MAQVDEIPRGWMSRTLVGRPCPPSRTRHRCPLYGICPFKRIRYIMPSMKDIILGTPEQLGAAIRLKRKEKGLTQSALAALLGAERKWVIKIESGNSKAEIGLVLRAFEALNLRASLIDAGQT